MAALSGDWEYPAMREWTVKRLLEGEARSQHYICRFLHPQTYHWRGLVWGGEVAPSFFLVSATRRSASFGGAINGELSNAFTKQSSSVYSGTAALNVGLRNSL